MYRRNGLGEEGKESVPDGVESALSARRKGAPVRVPDDLEQPGEAA